MLHRRTSFALAPGGGPPAALSATRVPAVQRSDDPSAATG
jgi:hypothetical protein